MVAVLLRFFKDPRNDEIALQHFFFFLTAAQEFFFYYICAACNFFLPISACRKFFFKIRVWGMGWGFACLCWPWGREFDWSCSPRGGDIWIFLRQTRRYLTADLGEKDCDGTSVFHFHASRMRRTVWKDREVMEVNESKRRLSEFHCFVFKFRLF